MDPYVHPHTFHLPLLNFIYLFIYYYLFFVLKFLLLLFLTSLLLNLFISFFQIRSKSFLFKSNNLNSIFLLLPLLQFSITHTILHFDSYTCGHHYFNSIYFSVVFSSQMFVHLAAVTYLPTSFNI